MDLKDFLSRFFAMSTAQPVEVPTIYELYGMSDIGVCDGEGWPREEKTKGPLESQTIFQRADLAR